MAADDHRIPLAEAIALTHAWQKEHIDERRAWMMPREIIDEILKQAGCAGIRIYAAGSKGNETIVMVGADAAGNDLFEGVIAEQALPCPIFCPEGSPLLTPSK